METVIEALTYVFGKVDGCPNKDCVVCPKIRKAMKTLCKELGLDKKTTQQVMASWWYKK